MDYFLVLAAGIAIGFVAARWKPAPPKDHLSDIDRAYPYLGEYVRTRD